MPKRLRIAIVPALVPVLCVCLGFAEPVESPNTLTAEEQRGGWELLFDGRSSNGWRSPSSEEFPEGFWVVEGGFLRGAAVGNRSTDLMTSGKYRNFELQFEWKIAPGGNSGVKYLAGSSQKLVFEGNGRPTIEGAIGVVPGPKAMFLEFASGLEYQMVDEERHPDGKQMVTRSGALYQLAGFAEKVVNPAGQINHSRIVVNGNRIEHWLNGVRVVLADMTSVEFREAAAKAPERTRRGLQYLNDTHPIALQSHTGAVWFRSLKIRRLRAD